MQRDKNHILGIAALFVAAISWGSAYAFTKTNLGVFSPEWLLALRFGLAGILMALIGIGRWKKLTWIQAKHGMWMGCLLYGVFFFFTKGLQYTAASRSAFIVGSYVIFVPLAYWIVNRIMPARRDFVASATCLLGISLILLDGGGGGLNIGDAITSVCTLFYAFHVVYSAIYAKEGDIFLLNMLQLGTAGALAVIVALLTSAPPKGLVLADFGGPVYLAVVSSMLPYICILYGQKYVKTTTSAIILSFESVFGCLASILVLGEAIGLRFILGACIVLLSFFITEDIFAKKRG